MMRQAASTGAKVAAKTTVVYERELRAGNSLRVMIVRYRGAERVDLREWYRDRETQELRPSRRGISCSRESFLALADGIARAALEVNGNPPK
jgi:hypothetical protein